MEFLSKDVLGLEVRGIGSDIAAKDKARSVLRVEGCGVCSFYNHMVLQGHTAPTR